ncbi:MAG: TerB family tellurite resistance protein [Bacteroidota bacterium]
MKTIILLLCGFVFCLRVSAQAQELQQLKLDLEKLAQFKLMLSQAKSGYQALTNGYNNVLDIGKANFNLHQQFLDQLLQVNPEVKNNPVVQRVLSSKQQFVTDFKNLISRMQSSGVFNLTELSEISQSVATIGEVVNADNELLLSVLTPGKFRMSDAERSSIINQVDHSVQKQVGRLKALTDEYNKLMVLRLQQKRDVNAVKRLGNLY